MSWTTNITIKCTMSESFTEQDFLDVIKKCNEKQFREQEHKFDNEVLDDNHPLNEFDLNRIETYYYYLVNESNDKQPKPLIQYVYSISFWKSWGKYSGIINDLLLKLPAPLEWYEWCDLGGFSSNEGKIHYSEKWNNGDIESQKEWFIDTYRMNDFLFKDMDEALTISHHMRDIVKNRMNEKGNDYEFNIYDVINLYEDNDCIKEAFERAEAELLKSHRQELGKIKFLKDIGQYDEVKYKSNYEVLAELRERVKHQAEEQIAELIAKQAKAA